MDKAQKPSNPEYNTASPEPFRAVTVSIIRADRAASTPTRRIALSYRNYHRIVRFQVLTAASMMFRVVFWVILPCKMIVDHPRRQLWISQNCQQDLKEITNTKELQPPWRKSVCYLHEKLKHFVSISCKPVIELDPGLVTPTHHHNRVTYDSS
jgi:hypothetical protein